MKNTNRKSSEKGKDLSKKSNIFSTNLKNNVNPKCKKTSTSQNKWSSSKKCKCAKMSLSPCSNTNVRKGWKRKECCNKKFFKSSKSSKSTSCKKLSAWSKSKSEKKWIWSISKNKKNSCSKSKYVPNSTKRPKPKWSNKSSKCWCQTITNWKKSTRKTKSSKNSSKRSRKKNKKLSPTSRRESPTTKNKTTKDWTLSHRSKCATPDLTQPKTNLTTQSTNHESYQEFHKKKITKSAWRQIKHLKKSKEKW